MITPDQKKFWKRTWTTLQVIAYMALVTACAAETSSTSPIAEPAPIPLAPTSTDSQATEAEEIGALYSPHFMLYACKHDRNHNFRCDPEEKPIPGLEVNLVYKDNEGNLIEIHPPLVTDSVGTADGFVMDPIAAIDSFEVAYIAQPSIYECMIMYSWLQDITNIFDNRETIFRMDLFPVPCEGIS